MNNSVYGFINSRLLCVLSRKPLAYANINGSKKYAGIVGLVKFYQTADGTLVYAALSGLPKDGGFHGFHIHSGEKCGGNSSDPFADVNGHYSKSEVPHPYHSGDMPPLLSADGNALSVFLTDRFSVDEVIGKTVIVHSGADDFKSQPSGDSGEKIACGQIVKT